MKEKGAKGTATANLSKKGCMVYSKGVCKLKIYADKVHRYQHEQYLVTTSPSAQCISRTTPQFHHHGSSPAALGLGRPLMSSHLEASTGVLKKCTLPPSTTLNFAGYIMLYTRWESLSLFLTCVKLARCFCVAAEKSGYMDIRFPLNDRSPLVLAALKIFSLSRKCRIRAIKGLG